MKLIPTPVKEFSITKDIPVFQPVKLRDGVALAQVEALAPELIVVAAYGRILPREILDYPKFGCINVHSSLLPQYRGAAPINWAILNGDDVTGVTIMHMAEELDAGDIIDTVSTPIEPNETAEELTGRLAELGGKLLASTVEAIANGTAGRTPQEHKKSTYAPMLTKELSPMDWSKPAQALHNQVRGLLPWPAAITWFCGTRCKIFATCVTENKSGEIPSMVLSAGKDGITIACGEGTALCVKELQADGGKRMAAADYLRGHAIEIGSKAGE